MNEKRFELSEYSTVYRYSVIDNIQKGTLKANEIIILLSKQAEKIDEQQATITKLEQICEKKMQEIENIKYSLKEIAYKYQKEVQFKADTDPNQAVKEVLCEQQATISRLEEENEQLRQQLQEKQEDEKLYANEILELNKTKKEMLNFKQLGGDY